MTFDEFLASRQTAPDNVGDFARKVQAAHISPPITTGRRGWWKRIYRALGADYLPSFTAVWRAYKISNMESER